LYHNHDLNGIYITGNFDVIFKEIIQKKIPIMGESK